MRQEEHCIGVISSDGSFRTVRLRKFQFQHNSRYKGGKQCIRRKLHRAGRTSLVGILCREYGSRTGM